LSVRHAAQIILLAALILAMAGCDSTETRSGGDADHVEAGAAICLHALVEHADFRSALVKYDLPLGLEFIEPELGNTNVVFIAPARAMPDGPYWRCEISKEEGTVFRLEIGGGTGEPNFVELREGSQLQDVYSDDMKYATHRFEVADDLMLVKK